MASAESAERNAAPQQKKRPQARHRPVQRRRGLPSVRRRRGSHLFRHRQQPNGQLGICLDRQQLHADHADQQQALGQRQRRCDGRLSRRGHLQKGQPLGRIRYLDHERRTGQRLGRYHEQGRLHHHQQPRCRGCAVGIRPAERQLLTRCDHRRHGRADRPRRYQGQLLCRADRRRVRRLRPAGTGRICLRDRLPRRRSVCEHHHRRPHLRDQPRPYRQ